ncbi:MlaD family protein [Spirillospora sp. NPDC048819]|uniref:MlaD family protein n=1 Tax=Spirillospora sp. NPDC048819 TaxID=3155268 RepID=UPI0033DAAC51
MIKRFRVVINLVFFALLGGALAVWAVRSIITVDALERPFPVTADFASSPGLREDLEVTHLGVRVGTVGSVRLGQGHVTVQLDMDRGVRVPAASKARVLRKSAVGEPYIELTTPSGQPGGDVLEAGDHIPLSRTSGSTDYKQLFSSLSETLRSVDPRDTRTLVHEAAIGLQGRGDDLNDMVGDAHRLTATLAANAGTLDALAAQLTQLTATLTQHRHGIASGINDLAAFTTAARQTRRDLDAILEHGPGRLEDLNALLQKARPGLDCLLTSAAIPTAPVFGAENRAKINQVLRMIPTLEALASDTIAPDGKGGSGLQVTAVITIAGPAKAAEEYATPVPRPTPPSLTLCPATKNVKGGKTGREPAVEARTPVASPPAAGPAEPAPAQGPARKVADEEPESAPLSRALPLLPPVLAAVIVLAAAAGAVRALLRQRLRSRR